MTVLDKQGGAAGGAVRQRSVASWRIAYRVTRWLRWSARYVETNCSTPAALASDERGSPERRFLRIRVPHPPALIALRTVPASTRHTLVPTRIPIPSRAGPHCGGTGLPISVLESTRATGAPPASSPGRPT